MSDGNNKGIDYSIVIPVYFNEGSLLTTMASVKEEVIDKNPNLSCELVFVDDGSGDNSLQELLALKEKYPDIVKVVKFTRNFGQISAILAGYREAKGKCVVSMSADGQDPTGLISDMLHEYFDGGHEIVICTRESRDESRFRIITSRLFYNIMKKLSFPNMPEGGFDFVLLGRRSLDVLLRNSEAHPFWQGQILWTGYKPKFIKYHRQARDAGESKWTFGKKLTYTIDGVMSYSFYPIRFMSIAGVGVAISGFLYAIYIFFARLAWGHPVEGWAPLMIIILVLGGAQLLMLGIIGEYLWRTLAQARNRDPYVIETIYD